MKFWIRSAVAAERHGELACSGGCNVETRSWTASSSDGSTLRYGNLERMNTHDISYT